MNYKDEGNKNRNRIILIILFIVIIAVILLLSFGCERNNKILIINNGNNQNLMKVNLKEGEKYPLEKLTRDGYVFKKWIVTSGDAKIDNDTLIMGKEESEVMISWDLIEYEITYDLDGGIESETLIRKYNIESESFELASPVKEGYVFTGWTSENDTVPTARIIIKKGSIGNRNYKANWESTTTTYNIKYQLNGGSLNNNIKSYTNESETFKLPIPRKNGYNFEGWYLNSNFTGNKETKIEKGSHGDKEYYAKWALATYKITYKLNGGIQKSQQVTSYDINTETFKLENPTKENYIFVGWNGTGITKTIPDVIIEKGSFGNREYEAVFKPIEYNITYNLNNGTQGENAVNNYNIETETFTLVSPTRKGYQFKGWYLSSDFSGDVVTEIANGSHEDIELYAKWEIETYTITYTLNNGIINGENPSTYKIDTNTFSLKNPIRDYYTFVGWRGTNLNSIEEVVTIEKGSFGNREYEAVFKPIEYNITYNLNNGTQGENAVNNYNIETETFTLVSPTRKGYQFKGWYLSSDFSGDVVTEIANGSHEDIELYAQWEIINYDIIYHANGGTLNTETKITYNIGDGSFSLEIPQREGYNFLGWYKNDELTEGPVNKIEEGTIGNKEFFAKWEEIKDYDGYNVFNMVQDGVPTDAEQSLFVTEENGVDFGEVSSLTNGYGKYILESTKNDEFPIIYYRGDVDNNNIIVGNFCWKIVRTTEKGGTKLIYNGVSENGKCNKTGVDTEIGNKVKFNSTISRFESIGYAYTGSHSMTYKSSKNLAIGTYFGNDVIYNNGSYELKDTIVKDADFNDNINELLEKHHYTCLSTSNTCSEVYFVFMERGLVLYYIKLNGGHTIEDVVNNNFQDPNNITNSTIKSYIDNWYSNNMTSYTYLLEDTVFCNDRSSPIKGGWDKNTSLQEKIVFGATVRSEINNTPSLVCENPKDRFTVSSENGNGILTYPVGLLTADEVTLSGYSWWDSGASSYLNNGQLWWTMSPSRVSASTVYIDVVYSILDNVTSAYISSSSITSGGVRPSIALKNGVKIVGGNGTANNPFTIEY